MAIGDVSAVKDGSCADLHYVDTGMYDTAGYGAVYLLDAERPALVDAGIGTNYERILDMLAAVGVAREELACIVPTHVHLDHAGGAGFLAEACPNATVAVHERGARHLIDPTRLWEGTKAAVGDTIDFYTEPVPVPEDRVRELSDGDRIDLGDHELIAHEAPGHAPHQHVFEDPTNDAVFTADAAGIYVPAIDAVHPTTPPPQFDLEQALSDVETLEDLDPETLLYAHFGPVPTEDRPAEYATVLAEWVDTVARARERADDDEAAVRRLVEASDMADVWGERKTRAEVAMNARGVMAYLDRE